MSYVIFSVNNKESLDEFAEAKGLAGNIMPVFAQTSNYIEVSYITPKDVFEQIMKETDLLNEEDTVIHVASGNKMEASEENFRTGENRFIGCLHSVCKAEAEQSLSGYFYRPDMNSYWIAKAGNPDNSYRESVARYG